MKKSSGFTLVEIAIVLVVIGLLLGGVMKGQELINSAKVKNLAQDFRTVSLLIYGYQDKYRALPGDHAAAANALAGASACTPAATANHCVPGDGVIDGPWNATSVADETFLFWQHVRLAGLAVGTTVTSDANYRHRNAEGGLVGIESGGAAAGGAYIQNGTVSGATVTATDPASYFTPTYLVCSSGILGRHARQLDTMLDDGETATGAVRVVPNTGFARGGLPTASAGIAEASPYIVCMGL